MKKSKVADMEMPRTPKDAMAPKETVAQERSEEEKLRNGEIDLDHLMRAEDIKGDNERMEYVHKAHAKKTTAMRSIADLKMAGQALAQKKRDEIAAQPRHKTRYPKREA